MTIYFEILHFIFRSKIIKTGISYVVIFSHSQISKNSQSKHCFFKHFPSCSTFAFALIICGFYFYHNFGYHVYSNHLPNFRTSSNRFSSPYETVYPIRNQMKPSNPVIHCCTHEIQIRLPVLMHSNGKTAKIIHQKNVKEISYSSTDHFTTTYPLTLTDTFSIQSQRHFPYNIPTTRFLTKIISKLVTVLYEECESSYQ